MSFFASAACPADYRRFLALTRLSSSSSSRSLSPEDELRQMTHSAHDATRHAYAHEQLPHDEHSNGQAGLGAMDVNNNDNGDADATARRVRDGERQCGVYGSRRAAPRGAARRQTAQHVVRATTTTMTTTDTTADARDTNEGERDVVVVPCTWQYGSPLYYPVTRRFYCWSGHAMRRKTRGEYGDVDGVSCDFCGFTHWRTDLDTSDDALATTTTTTTTTAAATTSACFYHCAVCNVDVCAACADDVARDERYHVPCMYCTHCGRYVATHAAALHRCAAGAAVASLAACAPPSQHEVQQQQRQQQHTMRVDDNTSASAHTTATATTTTTRTPRKRTRSTRDAWHVRVALHDNNDSDNNNNDDDNNSSSSEDKARTLARVMHTLSLTPQHRCVRHHHHHHHNDDGSSVCFAFVTRLAAETCAERLRDAGLRCSVDATSGI